MKSIALTVVVLACAFGSRAVASRAEVPFEASIDTVISPQGPCGPTCLALTIAGSGQARHLGRTTIDGPSQIDVATGAQSGTSVLTAADGSELEIAFEGAFVPGPGPADATFSGDWTVLSGSGRFDGATGSGTYSGTASGASGLLHLVGTISNPGRD